jgi:4-amino-4-deoxy-L-arabinose transferase-like glycosyltransferase
MSKEKYYKYIIIGIILIGAILRLTIFWVSPPNNSYDDHLEVIYIYSQDFNRPVPFKCWECYQPPLYYYFGAAIFSFTKMLGAGQLACWKAVQAINPLLSILVLILAYQILLRFRIRKITQAISLSFLAVLPRDIFTSAMIGNDYMLVFFSVLSFYFFIKTLEAFNNGKVFRGWFLGLALSAILGSLTKQHGLLLHLFPAVIFLFSLRITHRKLLKFVVPIMIFGAIISFSEEFWKYSKTGKFLVSNQHYFNYAENQYPGTIEKVEFFTFRIFELYEDPFISEKTSASFLTELFARTFFDYEWRFISPKIPEAQILGRIAYGIGMLWIFYFVFISLKYIFFVKRLSTDVRFEVISNIIPPFLLSFLFFMVPFLQTLRYPYFSSMKAMFMLSGLIISLIIFSVFIENSKIGQRIGVFMIGLNLLFGVLFVITVSLYLNISLNHLHGPLWQIP